MKNPKLALLGGGLLCLTGIGLLVTNIYYQQGFWLHYLTAVLNVIAGILILSQVIPKKK
jgi:hypothetical protein